MLYRAMAEEKALQTADAESLRQAAQKLDELIAEQEGHQGNIAEYASSQQDNMIAMVNKSIQYFHRRLEENVVDMVAGYHGMDFKNFVEQRVSKQLQREMENWVAAYSPHVDRLLQMLERELANGISYRFRQKVEVSTDGLGHFRQGRTLFDISAQDVSDANMKAGIITAGGAGLMMLIGGPILLPFISMAAFPFLQKKILEDKLATAKDAVIPAIQEQIAGAVYKLRQSIYDHIKQKTGQIVQNMEYVYDMILNDLKERVQTSIREKEEHEANITQTVETIDANMNDMMRIMNRW